MKIDFSQMRTAEVRAAEAMLVRQSAAKDECKRRITKVLSETAQLNLAADAASGRLSSEDVATFVAWRDWVDEMRATWPKVAVVSAPVQTDGLWPQAPAHVSELAGRY